MSQSKKHLQATSKNPDRSQVEIPMQQYASEGSIAVGVQNERQMKGGMIPGQSQEEEEIVAQVSSLINNMDLSQQNRLMSQLFADGQPNANLSIVTQLNHSKDSIASNQLLYGLGGSIGPDCIDQAIIGQGQQHKINQGNTIQRSQPNFAQNETDALISQMQNQGDHNFMSSLMDDQPNIAVQSIEPSAYDGSSLPNQYNNQYGTSLNQNSVGQSNQLLNGQVNMQGFDILRLSNPPIDQLNEDFLCGICHKIVNQPLECQNSSCGQLFCQFCCRRDDNQCPSCTDGLMKTPSKIILKIYTKYEITCNICCKSVLIGEILSHEINCQRKKCNNELCGVELKGAFSNAHTQENNQSISDQNTEFVKFHINGNEMMACSKKCKKVAKFAYMLKKNNENEILKTFESMLRKKMQKNLEQASIQSRGLMSKSIIGLYGNKITAPSTVVQPGLQGDASRQQFYGKGKAVRQSRLGTNTEMKGGDQEQNEKLCHSTIEEQMHYLYPETCGEFAWDPDASSKEVSFSQDCRHAFLYETNYYFRTITSDRPFFSGIHYWEVIADARTEHELKIGVTAEQTFNINSSFSDYEFGFAYYGLGQLRHSNNSLGEPYGKFFKKKGVLGVLLNMNIGTISFALDGEFMGVAFEDPKLTKGPIWAAVSLLHIGGLTLISGLEAPPNIPINARLNEEINPQQVHQVRS